MDNPTQCLNLISLFTFSFFQILNQRCPMCRGQIDGKMKAYVNWIECHLEWINFYVSLYHWFQSKINQPYAVFTKNEPCLWERRTCRDQKLQKNQDQIIYDFAARVVCLKSIMNDHLRSKIAKFWPQLKNVQRFHFKKREDFLWKLNIYSWIWSY